MNIALIFETALIILVAFLIGAILGYLIRCWFFKPQKAPLAAPVAPPPKPATPKPLAPNPVQSEPAKEASPAPAPKPATAVPPPPSAPAAGTTGSSNGKPATLSGPRDGTKDDLKRITGIGPKIESTLNDLGIFHFDQIAVWSSESVEWVNGSLSFKGRVQRENWIEQAKALAEDSD